SSAGCGISFESNKANAYATAIPLSAPNVIIKKEATAGYENVPAIIIQGHMDMVCEKNQATVHDFEKDPIELRIIGDMLYANQTTLGADNGIA
ncbi:hypothetical protein ACT453_47710, partial [Bacillus sp. D-CC]